MALRTGGGRPWGRRGARGRLRPAEVLPEQRRQRRREPSAAGGAGRLPGGLPRTGAWTDTSRIGWIASRGTALRGELAIPGDKSVSHRAVMLAALSDGVSHIDGFLEGADTRATAAIFAQMGVRIEAPSASRRIVHGAGIDGLRAPAGVLDCGNAGTGMRLLSGLPGAQPFDSVLAGDESLSRRPMNRVIEPLSRLGARIDAQAGGLPPRRTRQIGRA